MDKFLLQALTEHKENYYLHYHAKRYDRLLYLLRCHFKQGHKVLDIGRSPFTNVAAKVLGSRIDTLGFETDREVETGYNYQFNLNDAQDKEKWRSDIPKYDIIVFSEVIEHLYTSPLLVLKYLNSILEDEGLILLQTPNAVVAHKRLQLLFGKNPYMLISEDTSNPSHFREYTAEELSSFAADAGFDVNDLTFANYFDYRFTHSPNDDFVKKPHLRIVNLLYDILPKTMKAGISAVLLKRS